MRLSLVLTRVVKDNGVITVGECYAYRNADGGLDLAPCLLANVIHDVNIRLPFTFHIYCVYCVFLEIFGNCIVKCLQILTCLVKLFAFLSLFIVFVLFFFSTVFGE